MGQQEITKFLSKNKTKWFTNLQLSKAIKVSHTSTNTCLARLRKYNEVKVKQVKVKQGFITKEIPHYQYTKPNK